MIKTYKLIYANYIHTKTNLFYICAIIFLSSLSQIGIPYSFAQILSGVYCQDKLLVTIWSFTYLLLSVLKVINNKIINTIIVSSTESKIKELNNFLDCQINLFVFIILTIISFNISPSISILMSTIIIIFTLTKLAENKINNNKITNTLNKVLYFISKSFAYFLLLFIVFISAIKQLSIMNEVLLLTFLSNYLINNKLEFLTFDYNGFYKYIDEN